MIILLCCTLHSTIVAAADLLKPTYILKPQTTVDRITLSGLTAHLPCELPLPQDRATLILWYRSQQTKPFYSFDARETATGHHKIHDNSDLGRRSRFRLESFDTLHSHYQGHRLGYLEVENVTLMDAGNYTCRVDFIVSQTMMSLISLSVHEEIRDLQVVDSDDRNVGRVAGPYKKSVRLYLTCRALGGYPPPRVEWFSGNSIQATSAPWDGLEMQYSSHGGMVADHRSQTIKGIGELVTEAILQLTSLKREDNSRVFTCNASNTNLTHPLSRTVTIDMWLPPVLVTITGAGSSSEDISEALQSGQEAELQCRAQGSRPPAQITWRNQGPATPTIISQESTEALTTSRIRLVPTSEDNGKEISCTATNPEVQRYTKTTKKIMKVQYAPEVSVVIPSALDPENIKEGDDVYFECKINANPRPSRVFWLHEGSVVYSNKDAGLLVHDSNLVLQKVTRFSAGKYQCCVRNSIASSTSAPINLNIMYIPECREPRNITVSVTQEDGVKLNCHVDAFPEQVSFSWAVNNSRGMSQIPVESFTQSGRSSTFVYRPQNHASGSGEQYGVVYCWGSNSLGRMHPACVFNIEPAGPPDEPLSCSLVNHSATSLGVSCIPGYNGGLQQHFQVLVQDASNHKTAANISSDLPVFSVLGLTSGRDYFIAVTAVNEKGQSQPYVIEGFALKVAENKINKLSIMHGGASSFAGPIFIGCLVILGGFLICGVLASLIVVTTRARDRHHGPAQSNRCCCLLPSRDPGPFGTRTHHHPGGSDRHKEIPPDQEPLSPSGNSGSYADHTLPDMDTDHQILASSPDKECNTHKSEGCCTDNQGKYDIGEIPRSSDPHAYLQEPWLSHNGLQPHQYSCHLKKSKSPAQPLHSVDLPQIANSNHKYYTLKINCTRQNNESFV